MIRKQQTIPGNWVMSPLCEVADINPKLDKSAFVDDLEVSFVPMPAVEAKTGEIDVSQIRKFGEVKKGYTPFKKGDVLFAKITPCMENGKMAVVPGLHNNIGFGSTEFHVLRYKQGVEPSFLYYFVSSKGFRFEAEHNMTGAVGQRRVPTIYLEKCSVPLPPSKEQTRIVSKLEELFSELDKGIESFKTARQQLKVYRQAVLKHAFEGKLTEEWRKQHADELESAETLLKKIKSERKQRHQQQLDDWEKAVKVWEAGGKKGKSPTKPGKPKELPPLTEGELEALPELPEGWGWVRLGQLTWSVKDGPHYSPKYADEGIPFISGGNIRPNGIDFSNAKYISKELYEELSRRCKPEVGDILYTKGGTTGIARVNTYDIDFNVWVHVAVLKITESIKPFFLQNALNTSFCYSQAQKYTHGVGNQDLGLTRMVNIVLAICNISEQCRVIEEIESRLSVVEKLEQDIEDGLRQAETLRQSLLKKAFEGKLVAQDPNDEPASVLLTRIKAEKAEQEKKVRPRNQKNNASKFSRKAVRKVSSPL